MLAPGLGRGISLTALTALFLLFSPLLNYQVAFAQFPIANPGTEGLEVMVSGTGPVIATYRGNSATFSNDLYLVVDGNPANDRFIFNNQTSPVVSDHRGSNSQALDFEGVEIYPIFTVKIESPEKSNT